MIPHPTTDHVEERLPSPPLHEWPESALNKMHRQTDMVIPIVWHFLVGVVPQSKKRKTWRSCFSVGSVERDNRGLWRVRRRVPFLRTVVVDGVRIRMEARCCQRRTIPLRPLPTMVGFCAETTHRLRRRRRLPCPRAIPSCWVVIIIQERIRNDGICCDERLCGTASCVRLRGEASCRLCW